MDDPLRVFLINLDRSPDRLAFMRAEANRIGLHFERIPGVNGTDVPDELKPQFLNPDGSIIGQISAGDVGCYAGHLTAHQHILREDLPYALILEDDVRLERDVLEAAHAAIAKAPPGWDYIHLSGRLKNPVLSVSTLPNGRHLVRHLRIPLNMGGYLMSRSGAEKFLAPAPRIRNVDGEMHYPWIRGIDVLGVYPSPVIHNNNHMPTTVADRPQRKY